MIEICQTVRATVSNAVSMLFLSLLCIGYTTWTGHSFMYKYTLHSHRIRKNIEPFVQHSSVNRFVLTING